jgi:ElaB/YqjD/DUF883 family membrane-anchored ribosome-binding protein
MNNPRQQLVTDLRILAADSEELAKATATQAGEKIAELRNRIQQSVADLKPRLVQAETLLKEKVTSAAANTDEYVRARPWTAIGIAAGVGLVIGLLVGRR